MKNIIIKYKEQTLTLPENECNILATILQAQSNVGWKTRIINWMSGSVEVK